MKAKKFTKFIIGLLAVLALLVWVQLAKSPTADQAKNQVSVYYFNVGQGDSTLIEQGTTQILIDGGPDQKVLAELGKAMPLGDRKIEFIVLTHPHADHLVGLREVLDRYEVGTIYQTGVASETNLSLEFTNQITAKKIQSLVPALGESLIPFANGQLTFVWPGTQFVGKTIDNPNNSSLVTRFCYFGRCIFNPGDLEIEGWRSLEAYATTNQLDLKSDILKLAHHGSQNGTDQAVINLIQPQTAIISLGADNRYGHPHQVVLDLLLKNNLPYFRTDRDGTIIYSMTELGLTKR